MSQQQDMAAIIDLFTRTTVNSVAAESLKVSFFDWVNSLTPYEVSSDPDVLSDAKLRRDAFNRAMSTGAVAAPGPVVPVAATPKPTIKQGSRDPAGSTTGPVHEWQAIVGASPIDGIFGSGTNTLTVKWQKAHGLVADGIVGPLTWQQAITNAAVVGSTPTSVTNAAQQAAAGIVANAPPLTSTAAAVHSAADLIATDIAVQASVPQAVKNEAINAAAVQAAASVKVPVASNTFPVIKRGSTGTAVANWQVILGIAADGNFGPDTESRTKAWQAAHGLVADGIVGPATWTAAAIPGATQPTDLVAASFTQATNAVQGALLALHEMTPFWLKATVAAAAGWTGLLAWSSLRKKP